MDKEKTAMLRKFRKAVSRIEGKPITRNMAKLIVLMPYIMAIICIITIAMICSAYELGCLSALSK